MGAVLPGKVRRKIDRHAGLSHELLQNRSLQNEGSDMQDNSESAHGRLLRVAASFNPAVNRTAAKAFLGDLQPQRSEQTKPAADTLKDRRYRFSLDAIAATTSAKTSGVGAFRICRETPSS